MRNDNTVWSKVLEDKESTGQPLNPVYLIPLIHFNFALYLQPSLLVEALYLSFLSLNVYH